MEIANKIQSFSSENYLRELLFILSVQKVLIGGVAALIFGVVLLVALFWPASYTSHAKIIVNRLAIEPSLGTLEKVNYRIETVSKNDLNSEAQMLLSEDLIAQVILQLQQEGKVFLDKKSTNKEWLAKKVAQIKGALSVEAIPYSKVLDISFTWNGQKDPEIFLARLLEQYLLRRVEMQGYAGKSQFFVGLSNDFLGRITKANNDLAKLMEGKHVVFPSVEIKNNLDLKANLEKLLAEGDTEKIQLDSRIALIDRKLKAKDIQFFSFLENEAITQFSRQIQELFVEKAKVEGVFVSDSRAVQGVQRKLKEAYKKLQTEVSSLKNRLQARSEMIEKQRILFKRKIAILNERNQELKSAELEMASLEKQNNVLQSSFETFYKRKEEATLASNDVINQSNVSILAHPQMPLHPTFPNNRVLVPFGFIVACLSGLVVGFLVEFFDHTFKRPEDIENVLGIKHLLSIGKI